MGLRQYKAARLKLDFLEQAVKLIGHKPFQDLHVADICRRVKVSKVTFFNYFKSKEELLMYWHRVWCFQRTAELHAKPKHGVAGLAYLSDKLSEEAEAHPGLIYSLIGYLNDLKRPVKPFPVKGEEKTELFPKHQELAALEIKSLDQMVEGFVLEAIQRKEITKSSSTRELTNLILAVLYGSLMVANLNKQAPASTVRRALDMAIKGLK